MPFPRGRTLIELLLVIAVLADAMMFISSAAAQGTCDEAPATIAPINAPFDMPQLQRPLFPNRTFNIADYGAKGDGTTNNTAAFRKAIEACHKAGGGKVLVPAGKWLTGAIHLKSNVNLHMVKDAEIHFSDDPQDYLPAVFTRWAGFEVMNYSPLIYANGCQSIAVTGPGKLFGHGKKWWEWNKRLDERNKVGPKLQAFGAKGVPAGEHVFASPELGLRPQFISPIHCRGVLLEGFAIMGSGPFWTIHFVYCENVIARGLAVHSQGGPNGDGINLDSTRNALVEHCFLDTDDDAVAIKSGINEDGRRVGKPSENIVVRHCYSKGPRWGSISIGSDMSGGVRNVYITDVEFDGTLLGVQIKTNKERGGMVENITYEDIKLRNVRNEAIKIDTNYGAWGAASKDAAHYPTLRNITYRDVTCEGAGAAVSMNGSSHQPIENVTLENISIRANSGMSFNWIDGLKLINVTSAPKSAKPLLFKNCKNVVKRSAPALIQAAIDRVVAMPLDRDGLLMRHVREARLTNVVVAPRGGPSITVDQTRDVVIAGTTAPAGGNPFLAVVKGAGSAGIVLKDNDLSQAKGDVMLGPEVTAAAPNLARQVRLDKLHVTVREGPAVTLKNCRDVTLSNSVAGKPCDAFVRVEGEKSAGIALEDNDLHNVAREVVVCEDVAPAAVAQPGDYHQKAKQILDMTSIKGGLIVHIGCADGKLTAALGEKNCYVVQGLDSDAKHVQKARQYVRSLGRYGRVSIRQWVGKQLPYADGLVNLIVTEELRTVDSNELLRVLAPRGAALVRQGDRWTKRVKPCPDAMDEWTHYLHGPDNNAVAQDEVVGPPKHVQWISGPPDSRSHEFTSSMGAMVTSGGRLFYVWDEAPIGLVDERLPSQWNLIARDAFNGKLLWKRPMPEWGWRQWHDASKWNEVRTRARMLRLLPSTLTRRLVADSGRIYVTLGYNAPVSVLDAATGEEINVFEQTAPTEEILLSGDTLVLNINDRNNPPPKDTWDFMPPQHGRVMAVDIKSGQTLWQSEKNRIAPLTLAVRNGKVYYSDYQKVQCLDFCSGNRLWSSRSLLSEAKGGYRATCGTLVAQDAVVLYAYPPLDARSWSSSGNLVALSAETGEILWKGPKYYGPGQSNPPDLFVIDGLVWLGDVTEKREVRVQKTDVERKGFDPLTGELRREVSVPYLNSAGHHYRCYRSKATERYLLLPKRGVEYFDVKGDNHMRCNWVRAPCVYGVLPANGLSYFAPHPCVCYPGVLLNNFNALASARPEVTDEATPIIEGERLHRGPAWKQIERPDEAFGKQHTEDWPMYRHDPERSGSIVTAVPVKLKQQWKASLGGEITPPVVANGCLLVAEKDAHTVHALEAESGDQLWRFTAGGRIDSPPTMHGQLVLFGSADGHVYCLRASDGELVWRFMAAPRKRQVLVYDQLESAWPVHGSVLVQEDAAADGSRPVVYFIAGRSSFLDGGIRIFGLDPCSGEVLYENCLEGPYPDLAKPSSEAYNMDGAKSDILVGGDSKLYLYQIQFKGDLTRGGAASKHLMNVGGFLDDTYNQGYYWAYRQNWPGCHRKLLRESEYAQLLVFNEDTVFGNHVMLRDERVRRGFTPGQGERLFARLHGASGDKWAKKVSMRIRGMVLTDENLFVAGAPDVVPEDDPLAAFEGRRGARLWAFSGENGKKLAEVAKLDTLLVYDGLIAAAGRLYMSLQHGRVVCFGERDTK
jgi:polygalacturonase/outer membrane protein assembly factor BamB